MPVPSHRVSIVVLLAAAVVPVATAATLTRSVSWWFDVAENSTVDERNVAAIRNHRAAFSRVMPMNARVVLDGNVSLWWSDPHVQEWNAPLQSLGVPVLPYLLNIDNSTQMHAVYANSSAVVADAVAIALHHGFQGWFIDYEDEYPPDSGSDKSEKLAAFLTELGDALHAHNMSLTICVASWSGLLADYKTLASSSVDELQQMSTYANPSDYESLIDGYFDGIRAGSPQHDLAKAGVGMGVYYDGHDGYKKEWTAESAYAFVKYVVDQGGNSLNIFRLLKDDAHDWPRDEFWWTLLSDFAEGSLFGEPQGSLRGSVV